MESVNTEKTFKMKKISELKNSESAIIRAFVVQSFEPRFFYVCPSCRKKAIPEGGSFVCAEHGKVAAEKRALINIVLDDGTETIRTVAFNDNLPSIGLTNLESPEELVIQRENLLGKEMAFYGIMRINKVFNTPEFIIERVESIDADLLIKELEET
jgi:hypothetical protein